MNDKDNSYSRGFGEGREVGYQEAQEDFQYRIEEIIIRLNIPAQYRSAIYEAFDPDTYLSEPTTYKDKVSGQRFEAEHPSAHFELARLNVPPN